VDAKTSPKAIASIKVTDIVSFIVLCILHNNDYNTFIFLSGTIWACTAPHLHAARFPNILVDFILDPIKMTSQCIIADSFHTFNYPLWYITCHYTYRPIIHICQKWYVYYHYYQVHIIYQRWIQLFDKKNRVTGSRGKEFRQRRRINKA